MREWSIYTLNDPITGDVRYVGWSFNPKMRLVHHLSESRLGQPTTHKVSWIRKLTREGLAPTYAVIETGSEPLAQLESEKKWIAHFRQCGTRLTNSTDGGEGVFGLPEDVKVRAAAAQKIAAKRRWAKASEREKQSLRCMGRIVRAETRVKLSESIRSTMSAPEFRASRSKISSAQSAATRSKIGASSKKRWQDNRSAMIAAQKSVPRVLRGPSTPEVEAQRRAKISAANKIRMSDPAKRLAISIALKGRVFTKEHRQNIRIAKAKAQVAA